eukprot:TRINITY_DN6315_c0_g2_i1.p1 TRINITY_DN6315_c0_g2~~TRINITY_DN6315_c0_g2_i1.p1  ORF type:complete len:391 (+),score=92.62 TRINITY_DN6315_c0_g2_i1:40-1212(+)
MQPVLGVGVYERVNAQGEWNVKEIVMRTQRQSSRCLQEGGGDVGEETFSVVQGVDVKNTTSLDEKVEGLGCCLAASVAAMRLGAMDENVSEFSYLRNKLQLGKIRQGVIPIVTVFSGGCTTENLTPWRGICIVPSHTATGTEGIRCVHEVYHRCKDVCWKMFGKDAADTSTVGGIAAPCNSLNTFLEIIHEVLSDLNALHRAEVYIDAGAEDFYDSSKKMYNLTYKSPSLPGCYVSSATLLGIYKGWVEKYSEIGFIQDPFATITDDPTAPWGGLPKSLTVASATCKACSLTSQYITLPLVTLPHDSTLTSLSKLLQGSGVYGIVGDSTEDAKETLLAFVYEAAYLKLGAPCRGENTAKLNELIRIEEDLIPTAGTYQGYTYGKRYIGQE